MKRRWIILAAILIPVLASVIWFNTHGEPPVTVRGNLPQKDVSEILRLVRHELKMEIFPDLSKNSLKHLPGNLEDYLHIHITNIEVARPWYVTVWASMPPETKWSGGVSFMVVKRTNGWKLIGYSRLN